MSSGPTTKAPVIKPPNYGAYANLGSTYDFMLHDGNKLNEAQRSNGSNGSQREAMEIIAKPTFPQG